MPYETNRGIGVARAEIREPLCGPRCKGGMKLFAAVVVVLVLAPAAAVAKGIESVSACGLDGCRAHDVAALIDEQHAFLMGSEQRADPPAAGAPFFRLVIGLPSGPGPDEVTEIEKLWVPSSGLVAEVDATSGRLFWAKADPGIAGALNRAVRGLTPLPAGDLGRTVSLGPRREVVPPPARRESVMSDDSRSLSDATKARLAAAEDAAGSSAPAPLIAAAAAILIGALVAAGRRRRHRPEPPGA